MAKQASRPLALFDFDGTLCRLETDYVGLRAELEGLGGGNGGGLLELILALDDDPRAREVVTQAELLGLQRGEEIAEGVQLYRSFAEGGSGLAVVSHNGHAVIEAFFRGRGLPEPDAILDRRALGRPKDESDAVPEYVERAGGDPVYVVGDSDSDRRLAEKLGAPFLDVGDELRSYYEGRALELDELAVTYEHPEPYKRFFYGTRFRAVLDALDAQPGERILEVGCGSGSYTRELAQTGTELTATEFAPAQLAQAERNVGPSNVVFRLEDAQNLTFPDASFDKVLLSEVIEHVPHPERAIGEAARVLRPGGLLVASTPSRFSPLNLAYGIKRRVRRYAFNEHLHEFTPPSFRRLVAPHLDVERLEFANFVLPYPVDELYLRVGSPGLGLLELVERTLPRLPVLRQLGWTMVLRARKAA
jgi:SAM-dependent methyltransferase